MHTKALPYVVLLSLSGDQHRRQPLWHRRIDPYTFIALRGFSIATLFFVLIFMLQRRVPAPPNLMAPSAFSRVIRGLDPDDDVILSLQYQSSGVTSMFVTTTPAPWSLPPTSFCPMKR